MQVPPHIDEVALFQKGRKPTSFGWREAGHASEFRELANALVGCFLQDALGFVRPPFVVAFVLLVVHDGATGTRLPMRPVHVSVSHIHVPTPQYHTIIALSFLQDALPLFYKFQYLQIPFLALFPLFGLVPMIRNVGLNDIHVWEAEKLKAPFFVMAATSARRRSLPPRINSLGSRPLFGLEKG